MELAERSTLASNRSRAIRGRIVASIGPAQKPRRSGVAADDVGQRRQDHPLVEDQHPVGDLTGEDVDRVVEAERTVDREVAGQGPQVGQRLRRGEGQRQERGVAGRRPPSWGRVGVLGDGSATAERGHAVGAIAPAGVLAADRPQ